VGVRSRRLFPPILTFPRQGGRDLYLPLSAYETGVPLKTEVYHAGMRPLAVLNRRLRAREAGATPLEKLTSMALETDRRALTNRVCRGENAIPLRGRREGRTLMCGCRQRSASRPNRMGPKRRCSSALAAVEIAPHLNDTLPIR
jgi:hypothetical protein